MTVFAILAGLVVSVIRTLSTVTQTAVTEELATYVVN